MTDPTPPKRKIQDADAAHPGVAVRQNCLERFGIGVSDAARALGVSRQALTNLLGGKAAISPEMALRLEKVFGGAAEAWLQRQLLHDLADARRRFDALDVSPVVPAAQGSLF